MNFYLVHHCAQYLNSRIYNINVNWAKYAFRGIKGQYEHGVWTKGRRTWVDRQYAFHSDDLLLSTWNYRYMLSYPTRVKSA